LCLNEYKLSATQTAGGDKNYHVSTLMWSIMYLLITRVATDSIKCSSFKSYCQWRMNKWMSVL